MQAASPYLNSARTLPSLIAPRVGTKTPLTAITHTPQHSCKVMERAHRLVVD